MKLNPQVEKFRVTQGPYGTTPGEPRGVFEIITSDGRTLITIVSDGEIWKPIIGGALAREALGDGK